MKDIIINGISVNDSDNGKIPLVFVHAFPLNSRMWDYQVNEFKENFRVITYDVRGLGKSKSVNNLFMMEHYADDLIKIAEVLNLNKFNAVGLSMGGYILQRAILKREDLFKTLTLADTRLARDTNEGLLLRAAAIDKINNGKRKEFIEDFINKLISKDNYKNTNLINFIREMAEENSDTGIIGSMLALATRTDNTGLFKNINTPCLAIFGEEDILTPVHEAENIIREFKNSKLEIIKSSGHLSNIEKPEEFNKLLNIFLAKHNESN